MDKQKLTTGKHHRSNNAFLHGKPIHQSGVVLIISLIMLLLLTLIGISGMQTTSLEEKMAGNMRDRNLAFQAAESALTAGEAAAATAAPVIACPDVGGTNPDGYYLPLDVDCDGAADSPAVAAWDSNVWSSDDTKSIEYNTDGDTETIDLDNIGASPRYIVEYLGTSCDSLTTPCPAADQRKNYRITARATGGTEDAVVMVQAIRQI